MASVISSIFGSAVRPMDFSQSMDASASVSNGVQNSLLSLVSNVSTKINLDISQEVDPSRAGAQCVAENAIKGIEASKQVLNGQIAGALEDIAAVQGEIIQAVKASGRDVGDVFPAATGNDGGDILISAAVNLKGGGTYATFLDGMSKASTVSDIAADRQGRAPDAVMAEIRDVLTQSSQPAQMQAASFGHVQDGNATPSVGSQSGVNWGAILEQNPQALEAFMYFDPSNPQSIAQVSPDLADMIAASMAADDKVADLEDKIKQADDMGTPRYCSAEAIYMVQLDQGFANMAFSDAHNPSISTEEIAGIASRAGANSIDKPPTYDNEAGLERLGVSAAEWGGPKPVGNTVSV